ncbi:hypothetical protein [Nonomuraea salmonea]|uniref:hypothetical protein n=1 Tax=Nonomuraea salmonea TaxID=46181 RepID=UPI0031E833FA
MPMGVLNGHTRLPHTTQPVQRHHTRPTRPPRRNRSLTSPITSSLPSSSGGRGASCTGRVGTCSRDSSRTSPPPHPPAPH